MIFRRLPDRRDLLKTVPLFVGLSRRYLDRIVRETETVRVDEGKALARQGLPGKEFFLIVEGEARVEREGKVIARLGPGDFFGEMSLIDNKPRSASVTAQTPVELLVLDARSFRGLLDTVPGLQRKLLVALSERLRAADRALASRN
jgi:CRP/FNR family cyclic AMP-dependent transcriptional regulator